MSLIISITLLLLNYINSEEEDEDDDDPLSSAGLDFTEKDDTFLCKQDKPISCFRLSLYPGWIMDLSII